MFFRKEKRYPTSIFFAIAKAQVYKCLHVSRSNLMARTGVIMNLIAVYRFSRKT